MSVEAALYTVLSGDATLVALVGGSASPRIYPLGIPAGKSVPAVVYQQISGQRPTSCDGTVGICAALFQITCWAEGPSILPARALADAVRNALDDYSGTPSGSGTEIKQARIADEGDALNMDEEAETADRVGKRLDFEILYVD